MPTPIYRVLVGDQVRYEGDDTYQAQSVRDALREQNDPRGVLVVCDGRIGYHEFFFPSCTVVVKVPGLGEVYRETSGPVPMRLVEDLQVQIFRGELPDASLPVEVHLHPNEKSDLVRYHVEEYDAPDIWLVGEDLTALRALLHKARVELDDNRAVLELTSEQAMYLAEILHKL